MVYASINELTDIIQDAFLLYVIKTLEIEVPKRFSGDEKAVADYVIYVLKRYRSRSMI